MKTQRERFMAFAALGVVAVTLFGLLYFFYYHSNMTALENRTRTIAADQRSADDELEAIDAGHERLKAAQVTSLPADVTNPADIKRVLREYNDLLRNMLTDSRFPTNKVIQFTGKVLDKPAAAGQTVKRPPMVHLTFDLTLHGNEIMLTDFLERFYRAPMLHRIKSLIVGRPVTRTNDQMKAELEIRMNIEALILDGAQQRKTLLPAGVKEDDLPSKPARADSQYAMIPGRNIFYGPGVVYEDPPVTTYPPKPFDLLPEIVLDGITSDDSGCVASFFDAANILRYNIRSKQHGGPFRVDVYWFLNEQKAKKDFDHIGETQLTFRDGITKKEYGPFTPIYIDHDGVILEDVGKYYFVHIGYHVSDARLITPDDPEAKWLPPPTPKKEDKDKANSTDKNQKKVSIKSSGQ